MTARRFRDLPIDRKLLRMSLLATSAALLLASASFLTYDLMTFRQSLASRLEAFADIVGYNSASAILFNDQQAAFRNLRALEPRTSITAAALYTAKGDPFTQWVRSYQEFPFPPGLELTHDVHRFRSNSVEIFHPIYVDRSRVGTIYIFANMSERRRRLERYTLIVLGVMALSLLLSGVIALELGRRISQPILELAEVAQHISQEKNYGVRARSTAGGEIGLLVNAFNDMLGQIEQRGYALEQANADLERKVEERTHELRHKEEELYQSRRMESVGRLAGGVAHDFNNLLTGIIGCSEILEAEIPSDSPLAVEVQEIKRAGDRASALTRQLLAFGRKQIISPQVIDLNAQLQVTGKLLRRLIGEDIELHMDLDPTLGKIRADPGQLDQVVLNIAVNARDAMPKGGKLFLRTSNISLASEAELLELKPGVYTVLTITDTGTGMSREVQAQIFEPFFTTKEQGKGTGLGLSTVYGIVKQNSGGIQVHTSPGMGTTFKVFLPQASEETPTETVDLSPGGESTGAPGGREVILLVEDEVLVASHVARALRRKGYHVITAGSGKDALETLALGDRGIDLVLTDVVMPEMNGRQLVERLHERWPALKVLFMSGYPAEVIAQHGVLEVGLAFLEKPFRTEQLYEKIREVLDTATAA